jgi:hypothetical protein
MGSPVLGQRKKNGIIPWQLNVGYNRIINKYADT